MNGFAQDNKAQSLPQFLLPLFEKGKVLLKSGAVTTSDLNYNMVDEEMIFINNGAYYALDKLNEIDTVFLNKRKFVPVGKSYYEVVVKNTIPFFIQYKSKYTSSGTPTAYGLTSQVNDPTTFRTIRSGNQVRDVQVPDNVTVSSEKIYWVLLRNEMKSFRTQKQFLKFFPEKSKELEEFINKNNIDFKKPEQVKSLIIYCNGLY